VVTQPQTTQEVSQQVQDIEATLSPSQQAQFAALQAGRRLSQVTPSDLATASKSDQSGAASAQHLSQVHATNQNYEAQKQAMANAFAAQQQALQQQLAAAPAGSPAKQQIEQQIASDQNAYLSEQAGLKAQAKSQNMNAQNWVGNVDWAAVPWPSTQGGN
jgi:hypothetical protein